MNIVNSFRFGEAEVDLFPQDNAASVSEVNSIGSMVANLSATVTSDSDSYVGSWAIKVVSGGQSYSNCQFDLTGLDNGGTYKLTCWTKVDIVDAQAIELHSANGWTATTNVPITDTTYTEYSITGTTNSTTAKFVFLATQTPLLVGRTIWFDLTTIVKQ